jgi:uncharacterized protein
MTQQDDSLVKALDAFPALSAEASNASILKRIASELGVGLSQVEHTVTLIDDGNTIPFIARYRKEATGSLDDQQLRDLYEKLQFYRALSSKKEDVRRFIFEQGFLTPEIAKTILQCATITEVEDIYRPFRPKRRTRAMIAKEKGLTGFAQKILECRDSEEELAAFAGTFLDAEKGVESLDDVFGGACDILAEAVSEDAALRKRLRTVYFNTGTVDTKTKTDKPSVYEMYYDYHEPVSRIAGHRVLAINRGEREEILSVRLNMESDYAVQLILDHVYQGRLSRNPTLPGTVRTRFDSAACRKCIDAACTDAWKRLIAPSLENEIRNELTEQAEDKAIQIFSANLKSTIMQPPIKGKNVLGFDPAFRTGCKLAVVESTGKCLATTVIYPTPPQSKVEEAARVMVSLIRQFHIDLIAIGNGTASRESEIFVSSVVKDHSLPVRYFMVNEAGASVYSASELGSQEFPDYDVSLRSAVSIARRLQDPLAELVKIDPQSIGVGQYQHDMNQKRLKENLGGVVEDCVNAVGVDLNTASPSLLSYVAGISQPIARNIVAFRDQNGAFTARTQLLKVTKLGAKTYEQCAGFLRIPGAAEVLDTTSVHPESYAAAKALLKQLGNPSPGEIRIAAQQKGVESLAKALDVGIETLTDIIESIAKPGRDPREDAPQAVLRSDVLDIKDLKENMILVGVVRNVSAFGAFVDIGVHQDGLVHISQLSDTYVKNPTDFIKAGQTVKVRVLAIDIQKKRISLSMKELKE